MVCYETQSHRMKEEKPFQFSLIECRRGNAAPHASVYVCVHVLVKKRVRGTSVRKEQPCSGGVSGLFGTGGRPKCGEGHPHMQTHTLE